MRIYQMNECQASVTGQKACAESTGRAPQDVLGAWSLPAAPSAARLLPSF